MEQLPIRESEELDSKDGEMAVQIIDGNQAKTKIPREGKLVQQARPENARRNSSKGKGNEQGE